MANAAQIPPSLAKAPTGIRGFDAITGGGLPRGRPSLITGGAGSGKTLFATEFLARGARQYGESGVLVTFEESRADVLANMASLGFDLEALIGEGRLAIEPCLLSTAEIVAGGRFDLEGLFVRLERAVAKVGARRLVLDTIELLLGAFGDEATVRNELNRLFRWLKERSLTTVVTGERGREGSLTRHGMEEYVSDCVVVLDHRVREQISTRRLRVLKFRGTAHGTNEYPFLITERGLLVLPITALGLSYGAPDERVSTGIPRLDAMLGGGLYRGSTVLISGSAGTGKTTVALHAVEAACRRGERALMLSLEESPAQLIRNMRSVGLELQPWLEAGLLRITAQRASSFGLEEHLGRLERLLEEFEPSVAVVDAMRSVTHLGDEGEVTAMVAREIDLMKSRGITFLFTSLSESEGDAASAVGVSSLTDTWVVLSNVEHDGERNRLLYVLKSRGTAHSNQVREFVLTDRGAELLDVVVGPEGVLTGSARLQEQERQAAAAASRAAEIDRRRRALDAHRAAVEARIAGLRSHLEVEEAELEEAIREEDRCQSERTASQENVAHRRQEMR